MIISINIGGLSNRLKCLVSCMRYADMVSTDCGVLWKVLNDYSKHVHILNCDYRSLLNIEGVSYITESCKDYLYYDMTRISDRFMIHDSDNIPTNFNTFNSKCNKKFVAQDKHGRDIDFMYNKIPKSMIDVYKPYFQRLKLIPELEQKVSDFAIENFDEYTISVHIRSWNRNGEKGRHDYLFDIAKFEKAMEEKMEEHFNQNYPGNCKFFLTTDSQEVKDYFTKESQYKDSIITYPRETNLNTSRDFKEGVQEDAIELFLLGKNNALIGSHFSTYSEVAWWLAGCPTDVTIL